MNLNWLKTFVTAASYENFRETSEKLYLAQPTVTVHIQQLEKQIGSKLFMKSGRRVMLSEAGRQFLPHARELVEQYETSLRHMNGWRQGYHRKLTIAVSPLIAATVLPNVLQQFMKAYPSIEVVVKVSESNEIGEMITKNDADFGLSRMKSLQAYVKNEQIGADPIVLVVPHDGGDAETSLPLSLSEFCLRSTLLTHNHPDYWEDLLVELRSKYDGVRTMVVSQVHITKRFIEEGLGFSFLPWSSVRREVFEGRILQVDTEEIKLPEVHTYMVYQHLSEETEIFKQFIEKSMN
ncbi:LysR family transcriptional regulator [Alkalihalobacillus hwajinpoensis]|uniref:LysR family transcriptional regulator n=1 Tax=Guptibacillus hwajinpoensis TaxID=208199 RepID=UPI00188463B8|nr:LysR family transcriptional regulator [Pseudalkalibacillus hwajinpoensis]MBF0707245.1 LysR family transcriptional regulator [Pseudalkalibacillus hwajinpoensis]